MTRAERLLVVAIGGLVAVGAMIGVSLLKDSPKTALERTRQKLRQQGFKLELSEFDLRIPPDEAARAAVLDGVKLGRDIVVLSEAIEWLPPIGTNAAKVVWNRADLPTARSVAGIWTDVWAALRRYLGETDLEPACAAALAGPYRDPPPVQRQWSLKFAGSSACRLSCPLAARAMLALHDEDRPRAWTNLLVLTRFLARWREEPFDLDFYYWQLCNVSRAYGVTWQALQAGGWTDAQLATLQKEWEAADFRGHGLPEMAAFARAYVRLQYSEPPPRQGPWLNAQILFQSPRQTWTQLSERWQRKHYWRDVRYREEAALLLLFRDCEIQYRRALARASWQEMAALPGMHTLGPTASNLVQSARQAATNLVDLGSSPLGWIQGLYRFGFQPQVEGPLWRIATAETMRRLLVTAISLERFRLRYGSYPDSLGPLTPAWLTRQPMDFMDGQPLRYRRLADGRFLLYSVGLDCNDDGGQLRPPSAQVGNSGRPGTDLVWPLPATPQEVAAEAEM
jgi:hypothetical protein